MFGDFELIEVLSVTVALLAMGYLIANRRFLSFGLRNLFALSFLALLAHLLCANLEQVFLPRIFNLLGHFFFALSSVLLLLGAWGKGWEEEG